MTRRVASELVYLLQKWRRESRLRENWKTPYVARWMEVPNEYVDRLFSGEALEPSPYTLRSLALAFDAPPKLVYQVAGVERFLTDDDARADYEFHRIIEWAKSQGAEYHPNSLETEVVTTFTPDQKRFVIDLFEAKFGRAYLWRMIDTG